MKVTISLPVETDYFDNHATPDEIKEWEKYNKKGSFENGTEIKETLIEINNYKEAVPVKDEKTFKSIFNK